MTICARMMPTVGTAKGSPLHVVAGDLDALGEICALVSSYKGNMQSVRHRYVMGCGFAHHMHVHVGGKMQSFVRLSIDTGVTGE
jgi:hypothetical protein